MEKIAFIGGGHIAQAMIYGLVQSGFNPSDICVSNPTPNKLRDLLVKTKVKSTTNNTIAVNNSDIIFICVRPKAVQQVISEIKDAVAPHTIVVSVAACVDFALLNRYFEGKKVKLIRIMPNIPVEVKNGVIGFIAHSSVATKEKMKVIKILQPLGLIVECKSESMLDKLSLISGCGPGFISYLIESLKKEAQHLGFNARQAEAVAVKSFEGTIAHLIRHDTDPQTLVKEVATAGGITEKIISTLASSYPSLLRKSLRKGYDRITDVAKQLKKEEYGNDK